jgi:hypothetical protein
LPKESVAMPSGFLNWPSPVPSIKIKTPNYLCILQSKTQEKTQVFKRFFSNYMPSNAKNLSINGII